MAENNEIDGIIPTGGGAKSNLWVQIKANILGKSFFIPECIETACMGAALLGTLGVGATKSIIETSRIWTNYKEIIQPAPIDIEKYRLVFKQQGNINEK